MLNVAGTWGQRSEEYFIKVVMFLYSQLDTQREVAAFLNIPFGTFRRWLRFLGVKLPTGGVQK